MVEIIVQPNQCLLDIAIQYLGHQTGIVDICILNNLSISDDIYAGQTLILPDEAIDKDIAEYFAEEGLIPATAESDEEFVLNNPGGIGYWIIENNFIVS